MGFTVFLLANHVTEADLSKIGYLIATPLTTFFNKNVFDMYNNAFCTKPKAKVLVREYLLFSILNFTLFII